MANECGAEAITSLYRVLQATIDKLVEQTLSLQEIARVLGSVTQSSDNTQPHSSESSACIYECRKAASSQPVSSAFSEEMDITFREQVSRLTDQKRELDDSEAYLCRLPRRSQRLRNIARGSHIYQRGKEVPVNIDCAYGCQRPSL